MLLTALGHYATDLKDRHDHWKTEFRQANPGLDPAEQVFDRLRPDVLLTDGGHPAGLELIRRARQRWIAVVFHLHNFGSTEPKGSDSKNDGRAFADVSAVIFPSEYSRRHHARLLGLVGPVIPDPIPLDRIVAADPEPKYVTIINPEPSKGMAVLARIAVLLNERRPDIPLLVVEGRGTSDALAGLPIDLSGLTNLNWMANTPDPPDFYRVSRAVLVPSLWRESFGSPVPPETNNQG
jgi:glycosyltransferase involved in cell wall biosynthesis